MKEKQINSGIYQIKNLINNKIYIGSAIDLKRRKNDHFRNLIDDKHKNIYLQTSFNKHGEQNFEFSVIEYIENTEILLEREQYYINKFFDNCNNCYNMCPTAGNTLGRKHREEIRKKMSKNRKGKGIGRKLTKEEIEKLKEFQKFINYTKLFGKKVCQYDINTGELLKMFDSISLASQEINGNVPSIVRCCKGGRKSYKGYIWRYENENIIKIDNVNDYMKDKSIREVCKYDMKTGDLIKTYDNMTIAGEENNLNITNIYGCCVGVQKTCGSYIWKYKSDNIDKIYNLQDYVRIHYTKKVCQYDLNGKLIKIWNSLLEVSNYYKTSYNSISNCCNGKSKTSIGYKWKFFNEIS